MLRLPPRRHHRRQPQLAGERALPRPKGGGSLVNSDPRQLRPTPFHIHREENVPAGMTAPSTPNARARQLAPALLFLNAAHELRDPDQRVAFFREAGRVLRTGGRIVVIEQVRNVANFACFGPAAFHFLSRRAWLKTFVAAGLAVTDEFTITFFVRAFVLNGRRGAPSERKDRDGAQGTVGSPLLTS
jgi:hypothetical protein